MELDDFSFASSLGGLDCFLDNLDWDKKNYKFNRDEKDMHPYSVVNTKDNSIIVHNIVGINKEDLKLICSKENGDTYIKIEGKTKDSMTGKEYSISSRFAIDPSQLDIRKITSSTKNGLLYIIIPCKPEEKPETIKINII